MKNGLFKALLLPLLFCNPPAFAGRDGDDAQKNISFTNQHRFSDNEFFEEIKTQMNTHSDQSINLDLSGNMLTDELMFNLNDLFKSVAPQILNLSDCHLKNSSTIIFFQKDESISNFFLSQVKSLNLSCNQLTGVGVLSLTRALPYCHSLTMLDLSHNPIGENIGGQIGVALQALTTLQRLNLCQTNIDDVSVGQIICRIKVRTNLENLDLSHNDLGDTGAMNIRWLMSETKSIRFLDVSFTRMEDLGLKKIALGLKENNTLHELNLEGNEFTNNGLEVFQRLIGDAEFQIEKDQEGRLKRVFRKDV